MNPNPAPAPDDQPDIFTAYGSNAFRLPLRQWGWVLAFAIVFVVLTPWLWPRLEKLEPAADFRMNYDLSNDYWLYERAAKMAAERCDTMLIGDSVVWGQYVKRDQTLSHYLNELAGRERVANLGLDGAHPVALAGLIEYYAAAVANKNAILFCNPLWMSSPQRDLQTAEEFRFNHAKLVPQFSPWIPCYKENVAARLGNVVDRNFAFNGWTGHLQTVYFDKSDIPGWTLEHPYASPLSAVTLELPKDADTLRHDPVPWTTHGAQKQDFAFVPLETSLQWRAFQRAIEILKARGNRIAVVIVPLNEHMMTEPSRLACAKNRADIDTALRAQKIECFAAPILPSEMYADTSHPLSDGYRLQAKQIVEKQILSDAK